MLEELKKVVCDANLDLVAKGMELTTLVSDTNVVKLPSTLDDEFL